MLNQRPLFGRVPVELHQRWRGYIFPVATLPLSPLSGGNRPDSGMKHSKQSLCIDSHRHRWQCHRQQYLQRLGNTADAVWKRSLLHPDGVIQWIFEDSSYSRSPILKPIAVIHYPLPDSQCSCRRLPPLLWKRSTLEHPHCCHGGVPHRRSISHGLGSHKYTGRVCCCHKRS